MADVADVAGVSVGTLYNYVEGKDALLLLCAAYAFDPREASDSLSLRSETRGAFLAKLKGHLDALAHLSSLDAALARRRAPADVAAECSEIVAQLFDLIARTRRGMDALERSARDVPDVAALFYGDVRVTLLRDLAEYIDRRAARGHVPPHPSAAIAARFVVESVTWFARHRHGDPDGREMDDETVRTTTIRLVTRSICGETT